MATNALCIGCQYCSIHTVPLTVIKVLTIIMFAEFLIKKLSQSCSARACPGTATLREFLDQEFNKYDDDKKFNYCQWDPMDRAILTTFTATYEEYKETLIDVIDDVFKTSWKSKNCYAEDVFNTS